MASDSYQTNSPPSLSLMNRIRHHRDLLVQIVEPDFGLLDELYAGEVLTDDEYSDIRQLPTLSKRNQRLGEFLLAKDEAACANLLAALDRKEQEHVANVLRNNPEISMEDEFRDIRPLDKERRSLMRVNHACLVDNIDTDHGLLDHCYGVGCISLEQKQYVKKGATREEKNRRLLDILTRRSVAHFNNFLKCLADSGQTHVANIMTTNGVICRTRAELDSTYHQDIQHIEDTVVAMAKEVLPDNLYKELSDILKKLGPTVNLVWCESGHSIDCYFTCETLDSLEHLRELYITRQLEHIQEEVFTALLKNSEEVHIWKCSWVEREYERLLRYFKNPPELSEACSQCDVEFEVAEQIQCGESCMPTKSASFKASSDQYGKHMPHTMKYNSCAAEYNSTSQQLHDIAMLLPAIGDQINYVDPKHQLSYWSRLTQAHRITHGVSGVSQRKTTSHSIYSFARFEDIVYSLIFHCILQLCFDAHEYSKS